MSRAIPLSALGALLATTFFFGSLSVAGKIALQSVEPFALVAIRLGLAALVIAAIALLLRRERVAPRDLPKIAGLAALGLVLNQLLFMEGLARTTAVSATILATTIPAFTFLAAVAIGAERLNGRKSLGVAVSFAGVVVLLGSAALEAFTAVGDASVLVGDVLLVLNSLSYSFYLVLSRPLLARYSTLTVVGWTFVFGAIGTIAIGAPALYATAWGTLSTTFWLVLAWIVLAATVGAYLLPNWALKRVPASTVASFIYLQPIVAAALAVPLLGERLALRHFVGGGLIVLGVWMLTRASERRDPEPAAVLQAPRPPRPWRR